MISVVIPAFNRGWELNRALLSLVSQTRKDFETIVCDDGSTEDIHATVSRFEFELDIIYLRIDNSGGPARPRNKAVAKATGEWISFLDSDDWWDANRVERVCAHLGNGIDLLYHPLRVVPASSIKGRRERRSVIGEPLRASPLVHMVLFGNPIANSGVVVRRDILNSIGGISEEKSLTALEDFDAWLRLVENGINPVFLDEILGNYWIGEDGISAVTASHIERQVALFARHVNKLGPELRVKAEASQNYVLGSMLLQLTGHRAEARKYLLRASNLATTSMNLKRWLKFALTFRP